MSTYTARIIIEGGVDLLVELDQFERRQIVELAYQAKMRAEEERRSREREEARQRAERLREATFSFGTSAEDLRDAFRKASASMPAWMRGFDEETIFTARTGSFSFSTTADAPRPPTARELSRPNTPRTTNEALGVLAHYLGGDTQMFSGADQIRRDVRKAKRKTHPDTGGTSADFQLVTAAEEILRRAGRI